MVEKLGDMKLKKVAGECLSSIAESVSINFILSLSYESLRKAKSPKVLSDSLVWIHQALMAFGTKGVALKELIEFVNSTALVNSNAAVRTAGVSVLGALRLFVGPG